MEDVVIRDIVRLSAGDMIPADGPRRITMLVSAHPYSADGRLFAYKKRVFS